MTAEVSGHGDGFSQRTAGFLQWFQAAAGTRLSPKIELADLRQQGSGRGVVTIQDLEEDEELFTIPRDIVLSATTCSLPEALLSVVSEFDGPWTALIVSIIFEYLRGEESSWYPYFQVLPTSFETLMFWEDTELAELQASAVSDKIGKSKAEGQWKKTIIPFMLEQREWFPVEGADETTRASKLVHLAHLAGSLIMAYAFDIDRDQDNADEDGFEEDDEEEPLKGMVPFADMLNADAERNNARLFQEGNFLIMKTIKPVKAGEQLFNDYGPLPRSDLLRMYGYLTPNYAQYDVVEFSHDLMVNVAGMSNHTDWLKRELQLDEIGIIDDGYAFPRPVDGESLEEALPGNIHMLLRGLTMEAGTSKLKSADSLSIHEVALLSAVATKKLSEYTTSLEHDRQLASDGSPTPPANLSSSRFFAAVEVRKGEKEILHQLIQICQTYIATKTNEIATSEKKRKHDGDNSTAKKAKRAANGQR